jgi:hypothetical protein
MAALCKAERRNDRSHRLERAVLGKLFARWINDPLFREQMRQDLEGTISRHGIELCEADWAIVLGTDWSVTFGKDDNGTKDNG